MIYIWLGTCTCDIFVKEGKFTRVRCWDNSIIDHIFSQYHRVIEIVKQYPNTKVKFIEVPCFSVFAYTKYNTFKGHSDLDPFKDQDKEVCREVEQLNSSLREINSSTTERPLPFNCDWKKRRKDINRRKGGLNSVRVSYKFAAYYDEIHADKNLPLIWTKLLTGEINSHCFKTD